MEQHFWALGGKFIKRDAHLLLYIQTEELVLQMDKQACEAQDAGMRWWQVSVLLLRWWMSCGFGVFFGCVQPTDEIKTSKSIHENWHWRGEQCFPASLFQSVWGHLLIQLMYITDWKIQLVTTSGTCISWALPCERWRLGVFLLRSRDFLLNKQGPTSFGYSRFITDITLFLKYFWK